MDPVLPVGALGFPFAHTLLFLSLFCSGPMTDVIVLTLNALPWETCHHKT